MLNKLLNLWDRLLSRLESPNPQAQPQVPCLPQTRLAAQTPDGTWTELRLPTRHLELAMDFLMNEQEYPPKELLYLEPSQWAMVDQLLRNLAEEQANSRIQ